MCTGGVYTMMLLMNIVTLVFVFTEEMQHLPEVIFVILLAEVNYACGMWVCCFWFLAGTQSSA